MDELKNWCNKNKDKKCSKCGIIAVNLVEGKCIKCRKKQ